jgi:hypothetical protein
VKYLLFLLLCGCAYKPKVTKCGGVDFVALNPGITVERCPESMENVPWVDPRDSEGRYQVWEKWPPAGDTRHGIAIFSRREMMSSHGGMYFYFGVEPYPLPTGWEKFWAWYWFQLGWIWSVLPM